MKKCFVVIAVLFILSGTALAKMNPEGKVMLGANGDFGFTITGIDMDDNNYSSYYGKTYGLGFKAGYGIFNSAIIYSGLEIQQRELVVEYSDGSESWKEYYTQKYLDFPLAFRVLFGSMYADFGGYYGMRVGNMKSKITGNDSESGTVDNKYTKNDYGLLLGIGGIIQINDNSGIDIGLKTKFGFPWVIDAPGFKISCYSMVITFGYVMII